MTRLRKIAASILTLAISSVTPTLFTAPVVAQQFDDNYSYSQSSYIPRTMDDLQQLAAPVALYPDALLAQVLVAASFPDDVIDAARWIDSGHDPRDIDYQNWDPSVRGVARYPQTLRYMAEHPDWTNDLGDAFLNQQTDVMSAVQRLRAEANAAGNLVSDDRQQVYFDDDAIEIIPSNPQMIYVPEYDPQVVYVERYVTDRRTPLVSFSTGIAVGDWLCHDLDWHDHAVYQGSWGYNRPWWQHDDRNSYNNDRRGFDGRSHGYVDNRPGVYQSTNITNVRNTTIVNNRTDIRNDNRNTTTNVSTRWHRDASKPVPQPAARTHGVTDARPVATLASAQPVSSNRSTRTESQNRSVPATPALVSSARSYRTRTNAAPIAAAPVAPAHVTPAPSRPAQTIAAPTDSAARADRVARRAAAAPQPTSPAPAVHATVPQSTSPARTARSTVTPPRASSPTSTPPTRTARPALAPSAPQPTPTARPARSAPSIPTPQQTAPARAARLTPAAPAAAPARTARPAPAAPSPAPSRASNTPSSRAPAASASSSRSSTPSAKAPATPTPQSGARVHH